MPTLGSLLSDLGLDHTLDADDSSLALSKDIDTAIKDCLAKKQTMKHSMATIVDGLSGPQIELFAPMTKSNRSLLQDAKNELSKVREPGVSRIYNHDTCHHTALVIRFNTPCPFTDDGQPFVGL